MASLQINKKFGFSYLSLALIGLICLVVAKDFIHASIRNYSFYLSESLLFGSFWLMFIPSILIARKLTDVRFPFLMPILFSLLHLAIFSISVFLISSLFYHHPFGLVKTFIHTAVEYGIVCVLVYSIHAVFYSKNKEIQKKASNQQTSTKIKVVHQNKSILLDSQDILYVKSEKPYIALVTKDRTYLYAGTLKNFLAEKAGQNFIQIHKSTLINTSYILSFTSRKNGDYDIQLSNHQSVRASRSFNTHFKPFFEALDLA